MSPREQSNEEPPTTTKLEKTTTTQPQDGNMRMRKQSSSSSAPKQHQDSTVIQRTASTLSSMPSTVSSTVSSVESTVTTTTTPLLLPLTVSLPLLVFLDMMGVALVVPLLHSQYFALAGVTGAVQREWLSSIFSAAQIVGGLVIGALSDSGVVSRHTILSLSFIGSAVAYGLISYGGLGAIVLSRVLVGLVKQTMTITTALMAHATSKQERATHVGRLQASVTVAFIVGPSAGAYLFSHAGTYAPIYCACGLFLLNLVILWLVVPHDNSNVNNDRNENAEPQKQQEERSSGMNRIVANFRACFQSHNSCLTSVVLALLLHQWVMRATATKNIATYYEHRYGLQPHQRGYLQSYQSAWTFIVQSSMVRPILNYIFGGSEVYAACGATLIMALVHFGEMVVSFHVYLVTICPLSAVAMALLGVSLKSVLSQVAPKQSLGSVFATLDVLQNAALVTVPFYRTWLFSITQPLAFVYNNDDEDINITGDPDPFRWLWASGLHWMIATVAFAYLLLHQSPCASMGKEDKQNGLDQSSNDNLSSATKEKKETSRKDKSA